MFRIDPVAVLNSDKWDSLIRLAAYNVINADLEAQAKEANRKK